MIIYGKHAVIAALANKKRQNQTIYLTAQNTELFSKHLDKNIKVHITNNNHIDKLTKSTNHQGVALYTSTIFDSNLENLYKITKQEKAHILILDHLEDPQNIGNIIRSAGAFNVSAIILPKDRSAKETPALIKASCGAIETIPIFVVTNIGHIIKELKHENFWILGLDGKAQQSINNFDMPLKSISIVGSEQNGIKQLHQKLCDWLIKITISSNMESLNAATAAAIIMHTYYQKH